MPERHALKVLMISLDKGLLGGQQLGDVIERHKEYGDQIIMQHYINHREHHQSGRLDIIVLNRGESDKKIISNYVTVYPTNSRTRFGYVRDALAQAQRLIDSGIHYDLVVTQDPFWTGKVGIRLKQKFGLKLLVHHHGDFFNRYWILERPVFNWYLSRLAKKITKRADAVRAVSWGIYEKILDLGVEEYKARVLPTPVYFRRFIDSNNQLASYKLRDVSKKIILTVGRNDPAKDFETLYAAIHIVFQKFPNIIFWQVGSDDFKREAIARKINTGSALEVRVSGKIDQDELIQYYHASDIFVLSSAHESFGKVLVEANACGKPVVATATTGAKDIVEDGINGYLIPVKNPSAMADKIVYLLEHPDEAKAMGQRGRKLIAKKFNGEKNAELIVQFWQDIVDGKLNAPPPREGEGGRGSAAVAASASADLPLTPSSRGGGSGV